MRDISKEFGLNYLLQRKAGPCSACGDGDTAMEYHNHEPLQRSYTLGELRDLTQLFLNDMQGRGHVTTYGPESLTDWKFETFLQWLARREREGRG